jgi:hypothetical protein
MKYDKRHTVDTLYALRSTGTITLLFSLVFVLVGTFFLFIGIREGLKPYRLLRYGVETKGMITSVYKRPMRMNEKSNGSYAPIVQFVAKDAQVVTYYSTTFTNFSDYEVGNQVTVYYDAENPEIATLKGKDNWILAIAFTIFGFAICLIFYPMLLKQIIKRIKRE